MSRFGVRDLHLTVHRAWNDHRPAALGVACIAAVGIAAISVGVASSSGTTTEVAAVTSSEETASASPLATPQWMQSEEGSVATRPTSTPSSVISVPSSAVAASPLPSTTVAASSIAAAPSAPAPQHTATGPTTSQPPRPSLTQSPQGFVAHGEIYSVTTVFDGDYPPRGSACHDGAYYVVSIFQQNGSFANEGVVGTGTVQDIQQVSGTMGSFACVYPFTAQLPESYSYTVVLDSVTGKHFGRVSITAAKFKAAGLELYPVG